MEKKRLKGKYVLPRVERLSVNLECGFAFSDYGEPGSAGDYFEGGYEYEI